MRQSELFTKTRREAPKDEVAKNAQLLVRAGFVHKELAGAYSYLPLGLRVLNKIIGIIREEMNAIGGQEVLLTALQDPEPWQKTGRFDDKVIDVWFKTKLASGTEVGLGNTHEEAMAAMMAAFTQSYQDLPRYVYQFQTKFRNEKRVKSGIMRTREFIMKDLYSFTRTAKELDQFYECCIEAYKKIFQRVGIGDRTYLTFASGGAFSKYSHEFQTICDAGEDTIYLSTDRNLAVNIEVCTPEALADLSLVKDELVPHKTIEVGNIFKLGTRFSEPLGLFYTDEAGERQPVVMGSYGIGPGRVLGTVAETLSDEKGLVWPAAIAPFDLHLIEISSKNEAVRQAAVNLYNQLTMAGKTVLYDDRAVSAGEKFADSDLIGIPERLVVSEKTLATGKWEQTQRQSTYV
ncbi:MAG: prolyl-tRNA synthetase [Candidatus Vogelbacteria bacterium]|nr:prolyl-tRNA synthetase [Candidatus Vogelbacteria bacterium]